ncbi:hypothetical protein EBZ35_07235, partial [bacterium]|nr:hypothetical protein [bacterium]
MRGGGGGSSYTGGPGVSDAVTVSGNGQVVGNDVDPDRGDAGMGAPAGRTGDNATSIYLGLKGRNGRVVIRTGSLPASNQYVVGSLSTTLNTGLLLGYVTPTQTVYGHVGTTINYQSNTLTAIIPRLQVMTMSNTTGRRHFINGFLVTSNSTLTTSLASNPFIQLGRHRVDTATMGLYTGDIAEVVAFNSELSLTDRYALDQYIANKWGINMDTDSDGIINQYDPVPMDPNPVIVGGGRVLYSTATTVEWSSANNQVVELMVGNLTMSLGQVDRASTFWLGTGAYPSYFYLLNGQLTVGQLIVAPTMNSGLTIASSLTVTQSIRLADSTLGNATFLIVAGAKVNAPIVNTGLGSITFTQSGGESEFGLVNSSTTLNITGGLMRLFGLSGNGGVRLTGGVLEMRSVSASILNESGSLLISPLRYREASVGGGYTQGSLAQLTIQLVGGTAFKSGRLSVTGPLNLNGTLKLDAINGYTPQLGDAWDVLDWVGTRSGTFSSFDFPVLPTGLVYDTSQLYTTGVIRVREDDGLDTDLDGVPNALDDFPTDATQVVAINTKEPGLTSLSSGARSNLVVWLSGGQSNAMELNAGRVRRWFDWSGNQRHAYQMNASNQPQMGQFNNKMVAMFDSSAPYSLQLPDWRTVVTTNRTLYVVTQWHATSNVPTDVWVRNSVYGGHGIQMTQLNGVPWLLTDMTGSKPMVGLIPASPATPLILNVFSTSELVTSLVNGVSVGSNPIKQEPIVAGDSVSMLGAADEEICGPIPSGADLWMVGYDCYVRFTKTGSSTWVISNRV